MPGVAAVDTEAVLTVLKPLWQKLPATAPRVRSRIEAVLALATARGWRSGENPAAWRGHLALVLPGRAKIARNHYAAMDYHDLPAFFERIVENTAASAALRFLVLVAARTNEVIGAKWAEIDFETKTWTVRKMCAENAAEPLSRVGRGACADS